MNDIDSVLQAAAERWRASQPTPPAVDPAIFAVAPRTFTFPMPTAVTAVAAVAVVVAVTVVGVQLGGRGSTGGGGPAAPSPSGSEAVASPSGSAPSTDPPCDVTKPVPVFQPGGEPSEAPPGHEWFGEAALYTALDPAGEVWRGLPASPWGYTQKTVWWSELWDPGSEPEPEIYVSGERLDAPGTFRYGPGTNASAPDIATAMMVGIDVPELGCWRVTAIYRDASLSYTVLVAAD